MDTAFIWIRFALCIVIILIAGRKVTGYGDAIAIKTGLGRLWIGLFLLAIITSLPELFTGISAVTLVKAPDLTVGDLFGANAFNLLNLALLDIAYHNSPLLTAASKRHWFTAMMSMLLVVVAMVGIFISLKISSLSIGWIGIYTPIIILLYLLMLRMTFNYERRHGVRLPEEVGVISKYEEVTLGRAYLGFAVAGAFVVGAGIWLAFIGKEIADSTGWGESFVGSLFLAFTTTLPELTVAFSALRLGAVDMCVANMIGSNLFNMTIIGVDDLFYRQGTIFAAVSESHLFTGLIVLLMTLVFLAGLLSRPQRKTLLGVSWYVPVSIVIFSLGAYINFRLSG